MPLENVYSSPKSVRLTLELHGELQKLRRETGMSYYRLADELVRLGLAAYRAGQRTAPAPEPPPPPPAATDPVPSK